MATETTDPIQMFGEWFEEARQNSEKLPEAVSLGTTGKDLMPQVRMVLLKGFDDEGFVFYTNLESNKASQISENAQAALCFYWKSLDKQVRVDGRVVIVSDNEADEYFATRPKDSQIGAWASKQSRELGQRLELERSVARYGLKFAVGKVPRPEFWSGYRVVPQRIEFWEQRPFRLHKRTCFLKTADGDWEMSYLFP